MSTGVCSTAQHHKMPSTSSVSRLRSFFLILFLKKQYQNRGTLPWDINNQNQILIKSKPKPPTQFCTNIAKDGAGRGTCTQIVFCYKPQECTEIFTQIIWIKYDLRGKYDHKWESTATPDKKTRTKQRIDHWKTPKNAKVRVFLLDIRTYKTYLPIYGINHACIHPPRAFASRTTFWTTLKTAMGCVLGQCVLQKPSIANRTPNAT